MKRSFYFSSLTLFTKKREIKIWAGRNYTPNYYLSVAEQKREFKLRYFSVAAYRVVMCSK